MMSDDDLEAVVLSRCHSRIDSRGTFVNIDDVVPLIREMQASAKSEARRELGGRIGGDS